MRGFNLICDRDARLDSLFLLMRNAFDRCRIYNDETAAETEGLHPEAYNEIVAEGADGGVYVSLRPTTFHELEGPEAEAIEVAVGQQPVFMAVEYTAMKTAVKLLKILNEDQYYAKQYAETSAGDLVRVPELLCALSQHNPTAAPPTFEG